MNQLPTDLLKSLQMANEQNTTSLSPHQQQQQQQPGQQQLQQFPQMFNAAYNLPPPSNMVMQSPPPSSYGIPPHHHLPHHLPHHHHPQHQMMMMDPSMMNEAGGMFDESQILEEIKRLQTSSTSPPLSSSSGSAPTNEEHSTSATTTSSSSPTTTATINTVVGGNTITRQDTPVPESKPLSSHKARTEYILNQPSLSALQLSPTSPTTTLQDQSSPTGTTSGTGTNSTSTINGGTHASNSPTTPGVNSTNSANTTSSVQKYVSPSSINPQLSMIDPFITGPIDRKSYTHITQSLDTKKERKQLSSIKGIIAYGSDQIFTNGKCVGILDDYMVWSMKGGAIRVVSRKVGKKVFMKGHKQYVSDLQCSVNLKLASVSRDRSLIVWKIIETDEKVHANDLRNPNEDQLGYAKLVHLTFSSGQSHKFFRRILWTPKSDKELVAITSDNQLLLLDIDQLSSYNNIIELDNDNIHTIRGIRVLSDSLSSGDESLTDLSFSGDGKYLACVSSYGNLYIWDRRTNLTLVKSASIYNSELINIQFCCGSENGIEKYFITSSLNNFDICLWYLSDDSSSNGSGSGSVGGSSGSSNGLNIQLIQQVSIRPETSEKFDEKVSINNVELDSTSSALFVSNLQYPVLFTLRLNKTCLSSPSQSPQSDQQSHSSPSPEHPYFDFITEFDCRYPIVSVVSMTIGINFGLFCLQTGGIHLLNIRSSQICAPNQQVKSAIPMPDLLHTASKDTKELVVANTQTGVAVVRQSPKQPHQQSPIINSSASSAQHSLPQHQQGTTTAGGGSVGGGNNFELVSELKRMERSILTQMELMIQSQTERQYDQLYKRIEKERLSRLSEERSRQKELIETISNAITNDLPDEISESILESLSTNLSDVVNDSLNQSLESDNGSIKKVIQDSFQTVLKSTVLPSFETSCRRMFEQISKTFERGMEELVKSPLKQYCQEVNDSTVEVVRQELKNVAQHLPSIVGSQAGGASQGGSSGSSGSQGGEVSKEQLLNLVQNQRFEEVFSLVLERADLRLLVWLCGVIDPRAFEVEIPLSQPILLTLVQQLSYDIAEQTDIKLNWLEKVIIHINPIDPSISKFSAQILEGIREHLAAKHSAILERGKPSDIKTIKLILHIVNSLTKDAMRF